MLDRPRFRGDPRHRSITETIRWSHDLLPGGPARLLERLAVFTGPFTADSGRAVADDDAAFGTDLDELVNASLVVVDERSTPTKYRLLDTIRRFGIEELRRHGTLEQAYDQFVDHVLASVPRILEGSASTWRPSLVHDLEAEYDDMAEALTYVLAHDGTPDRAYRLCGIMWAIVHQGHADDIVGAVPSDASAVAGRRVVGGRPARWLRWPRRSTRPVIPMWPPSSRRRRSTPRRATASRRSRCIARWGRPAARSGELDGAVAGLSGGRDDRPSARDDSDGTRARHRRGPGHRRPR